MKAIGSFGLVLHTHLPWVAHHGTWPVGEEWLHQAFTGSWRRVLALLDRLAADGYSQALTLGVTPVVAAMLDDQYCLDELHSWAGRWQLRAVELAARPEHTELAAWEYREATACLADLETRWRTGGLSSVLRPLVDAGVVEVLSGPATHPFQPLLTERFAAAALSTGLADTRLRLGRPVTGIWAPECGYAPGMAARYAQHNISHFVVDGPAVRDDTGLAHPVEDTEVLAFARDRPLSERIWSSRTGYPAGSQYRDFHTFDHASGFRSARVTDTAVADKRPWRPEHALAAARQDADEFVAAVVARLNELGDQLGRPGLVVAAFDTELFGHWWYEGPEFLEAVLRRLPAAGVRLTTLAGAAAAGLVGAPVALPASSWGAGQDWRIWQNEGVAALNAELDLIQNRLFAVIDGQFAVARRPELDQLAREALLAASSDWAFMISRDSAAEYAWQRARGHAERFHALADAIAAGSPGLPGLVRDFRRVDGPFGHLDARRF